MKFRLPGLVILTVCLLVVAPLAAIAQTTGTLQGTVTDQNGGTLPGVTVEATSPNLQGNRTATTGSDGQYRFVSVPPGAYKVTATLSGFGTAQKTASVSLDGTATVNLQMQLATRESVTVSGEAPLIDVASTTTGSNYTAKVIDKLPVGRNYASIVLSQPGVQQDSGETQGRALAISIYGTTSAENLFLIDGVNTTNVIKGFQGKNINTEFIQEVEVKTGGYQAEYGRATGGVINVVTKSGGNDFHGDGFGYYNSPGMSSKQKFQTTAAYTQNGDALNTPGSITTPQNRREGGVDLGGYAWKDRIWFFGAYDRTVTDDNIQPLTGVVANQLFNQHLLSNLWSGKLTFNIAEGSSIVLSAFSDPQVNTGALVIPASLNPTSYNGRRDVGGTDYAGRVNQLFGSFGILTAQYSRHVDRFLTSPEGTNVSEVVDRTPTLSGNPVVITGGYGEVFGPTINNQSKRNQYNASFTGFFGNNELKVGGDYQKDLTTGSTYYTGGSLLEIRPCVQTNSNNTCDLSKAPLFNGVPVFYEHRTFTASGSDFNPLVTAPFTTPSKRTGAFLQDQWRIIPTLTVNVGVRWDQDETDKGNGLIAFKLKNEWAPRAGLVWDFTGDGTSKLYASVGRFYYSIPTDLNARVFTANTNVYNYNYSPTDNATQDPTAPRHRLIQVGSFDGEPVDSALKAPYQDELTLGVEKALTASFSVGLKGTYRRLGRTVEDRCDLDYNDPLALGSTCAITNPGNGSPISNGAIKTCDTSANATDPNAGLCGLPGVALGPAKRLFRGIELTARKQFSEILWMQASYLYSSLRGNYSGAIREGDGQTDPGINADYDYNQFLVNAYGRLELDRPHQLRLDTVYNAPFGLSVGLQAYVRSGVPTSRQGFYNQFYTTELFLDQRGSDGRLPVDYEANLSLAYNINIGKVSITPQLYVFNLLNRQTPTSIDERFNVFGSYITRVGSAFYGQAGVEPGQAGPDGTVCPASSTAPCSDNPDYRKATARVGARSLRAALKISF